MKNLLFETLTMLKKKMRSQLQKTPTTPTSSKWNDLKGYSNSSDYSQYTWANFIDAEVINYYDVRFESLKGKPKDMEFSYEANIYAWNQIRVVYVPAPENGSLDADSIRVLSLNGTVLFENADYTGPGWGMRFAYRNDSGYREIQAGEINFSFSKSYVVEMKLLYSETYGL